ncbi:DUF2187 family protein [Holzapfeliella floricola]|uniref:DUF2187 domain-containing protein n=1 Tax=Holzapfeliella floricola DSM 23037 = JCM 16512 TaxID=1423744 RepID=A0A0R2DMB0_9LACO|nr:DUF2187 family protein [Holzapfeliella floricola]KRN04595.1 hypothetical protein FC86_GL000043 [Holzapfeliella floricola DSM 23037 = JCM 16512]
MDKEKLAVGQKVKAKVEEDLKQPFSGTIEKIYENSVLLTITDNEKEDDNNVIELNKKIIVNLKNIKLK